MPTHHRNEAAAACSQLEALGWTECPNALQPEARCFFKRYATPTLCRLNDDKPGMQVCIAIHEWPDSWGFNIELQSELPDGTWMKLHHHGFPQDIAAGLASIPRLLSTWEHVANFTA
jgi:hypothetical protein